MGRAVQQSREAMSNIPEESNHRLPRRIGIFGHVGNRNLGDEAIIAAVIQNVRLRDPDAVISAFTINPRDTKERHGVEAFAIRRVRRTAASEVLHAEASTADRKSVGYLPRERNIRAFVKNVPLVYPFLKAMRDGVVISRAIAAEFVFLITSVRKLKGIDLLIVAGSQQLIDFADGPWRPWGHPYTLFKWSVIAKLMRTKLAFVSVGAGPITSSLGRHFIRSAASHAHYQSYRDESSQKLMEQIGVQGSKLVVPDLVFSLHIAQDGAAAAPSCASPIIGINPVPFLDPMYWPGSSAEVYDDYVRKLARFASWLIENGFAVLFYPTQLRSDPAVIRDIREVMETNGGIPEGKIIDWPVESFSDLTSALSMTEIVVATRFHGIIIPYLLRKPVLSIAYHQKTLDLMSKMGQSEYVVDILSFEIDSLKERFQKLKNRVPQIRAEVEKRLLSCRDELDRQYDHLLRL
ncbi:MAG: polysaccharide pyruvyl transferase family protein [Syntrophorhabdales bacterium]|jgi:polysaccharide pyruvyl transferase WcaK-like protein